VVSWWVKAQKRTGGQIFFRDPWSFVVFFLLPSPKAAQKSDQKKSTKKASRFSTRFFCKTFFRGAFQLYQTPIAEKQKKSREKTDIEICADFFWGKFST
jgi:hypothetical protein